MNDKEIMLEKGAEQERAPHASHRKVYGTLIAAVVCILLALLVWISVMNTQDTDYIPIRIASPDGCTCTLSVEGVTVKGRVLVLRDLDEIVIAVPAGVSSGSYYLPVEMLELPQGVTLTEEWDAVLTVVND